MSGSNLMVYRYDDGVLGDMFRFFRKSDIPVQTSTFSGADNFFRTVWDLMEENVFVLSKSEIAKFNNPFGDDWIPKTQYYVRHPKTKHNRLLIKANKFMAYTEKEKIAEMIFYILEKCKPKESITITSLNKRGFKADLGANISIPTENGFEEGKDALELKIETGFRAGFRNSDLNKVFVDCSALHNNINTNRKLDYVWISEFPNLMAAVQSSNSFTIRQEIVNDIQLSGGMKFAEHINLDFDSAYDSIYEMVIEVK